jgi:hypothetical protein
MWKSDDILEEEEAAVAVVLWASCLLERKCLDGYHLLYFLLFSSFFFLPEKEREVNCDVGCQSIEEERREGKRKRGSTTSTVAMMMGMSLKLINGVRLETASLI